MVKTYTSTSNTTQQDYNVASYEDFLLDAKGMSAEMAEDTRQWPGIQDSAQYLVNQLSIFPDKEQAATVLTISAALIAAVIYEFADDDELCTSKLAETSFSMFAAADSMLNE